MSTYGGDSYEPEHQMQRQRVMEVVGTFIPEDEAVKASNGRYVCMVCASRPVFDTIAMLAVHRGGKRHKGFHVTFLERKKELLIEKDRRASEQLLNQGKLQRKDSNAEEPLLATTKKRTLTALTGTSFNDDTHNNSTYSSSAASSGGGSFFQPAYVASASSSISSGSSTTAPPARRGPQQDYGRQFLAQYQAKNPLPFNPYSSVQTMSQGEIPYNSLAYKYGPAASASVPKLKKQKTTRQRIDLVQLNEARKRNRLFEKGYRWDANGNMYRDETVEWDSEEEGNREEQKEEKEILDEKEHNELEDQNQQQKAEEVQTENNEKEPKNNVVKETENEVPVAVENDP